MTHHTMDHVMEARRKRGVKWAAGKIVEGEEEEEVVILINIHRVPPRLTGNQRVGGGEGGREEEEEGEEAGSLSANQIHADNTIFNRYGI